MKERLSFHRIQTDGLADAPYGTGSRVVPDIWPGEHLRERANRANTKTKISVCMAAYNGSAFIGEQIASILPQLGDGDEIVVVDDASSDDTVAILEGFGDERIRVIHQDHNRGVVQSFGRALKETKGELIFLADQDDIWREDKVAKFMELFITHCDVTLAASDCAIIDGRRNVIYGSKYRGKTFHHGILCNLIRNRYQGSAMAFRRSVLEYCLPFPDDIPLHDVWIGLVNRLIGKAAFIPEPLLLYRRHGNNKTPGGHAPVRTMIRWRWALIKNLTLAYMRRVALRKHPVD